LAAGVVVVDPGDATEDAIRLIEEDVARRGGSIRAISTLLTRIERRRRDARDPTSAGSLRRRRGTALP
jgi:hypothetical protein